MLSDLSPNKSNTMVSLVELELLVFPKFTPAVSNVQSLVFCSTFGCSLFVFFVFWPLHYRFLFNLQLLMSPFISSNVFLQSSWHYFNWQLLKHSDVAVRGVNIGLCIPNKWQQSPLKPSILPYVQCPFCLSHILLVHVIQRESQLRPYLPVMQPEETSKENTGRWHWYRVSVMASMATFYFTNIVEVRFIGGGNRSSRKKSMTCRKSLTNIIALCSITLVYIPITTRHTAHESTRYLCFG